MTDARYPERWLHDRRITRLSDRSHRAFIVTLAYGVANRTDGVLLLADLRDLPRYVEEEVPLLIEAGLMEPLADGTGFHVVEFMETQSSRAELEAADAGRVAAREKKAAQRAAAKQKSPPPSAVPGDVPGDYTGQARPGQARPGKALRRKQLRKPRRKHKPAGHLSLLLAPVTAAGTSRQASTSPPARSG